MSYTLSNLGSKNFEHLVQALSKKIIGEGVSIYGAGPDGQREATFNGKAPYPSREECWEGYWVIQAKFKEPNTKKADYPWIKDCFLEEMKGFENKKQEGKTIPDNYLFFTNIVLTPVEEKGIKDKINEIANQYTNLIPHIHIIGADDIYRYLDGNRDVAVAYSSYILSGDILSYLYEDVKLRDKERQNAFFRYLSQTFLDDSCSRMEQAGQVTEEKVSIDKVYVDLEFINEINDHRELFIEHSIRIGNEIFRFSEIESRKLLDKSTGNKAVGASNKYVLKGSAGQGKSTVCQFLAQIYRASFLANFDTRVNPKIQEFLDRIKSDNIILPSCFRVPVRIELRLYSSWMISRQKDDKQYDLITYISSMIANKSAEKFDNETLRLYLQKYSWVFFFDGLDEVPETSNRKDIMKEIENFIEIELRQADTDALFFATTRPEGYVGEFNSVEFTHINLLRLNQTVCFKYLEKLLLAIEDDTTKRKHYLEILNQAWDNKQIAFMMETPLQATIIAILVRAGGEPPRDKYSLFKEYFDIIIKREKQKGMDSILNNNQDLIEGVYYLLGYDLQKNSSTIERSDALISLDRMKALIQTQLHEDGIDETSSDYDKLLNDTYSMIVNRINFASEIREGYIGFSIRSMQEFLAAVYIVRTVRDEQLGVLLKSLAKSSYWQNTFIFAVECIAKIKTYYLDHLIDTILSELNGNDDSLESMNELANIYYGSQVAFSLLANNIFKNRPRYENKLCKYMEGYCKLQPNGEMHRVLSMSDNVKKELTNYLLQLESFSESDFVLVAILMQDPISKGQLEKLSKQYAFQISFHYFRIFNGVCPAALYESVLLTINQGQLLELNINQIADIIKNKGVHISEIGSRLLLMMTIKEFLQEGYRWDDEKIMTIHEYFNCDLEPICKLLEPFGDEKEITDYLSVEYQIPTCNGEDFEKAISLLSEYSLDGLSLVLKTITSTKIEDYKFFFDNILCYREEIQNLGEEVLIRQNILMWLLWQNATGKRNDSVDMLFGKQVIESLNNPNSVKNLEDFLRETEKEINFYSEMIGGTIGNFEVFYKEVKEKYSEEDIKRNWHLLNTVLFVYGCDYNRTYQEKDQKLREDVLKMLDGYFPKILEYMRSTDRYSYWIHYLWNVAFLKMVPKDYLDNANLPFFSLANLKRWRPRFNFEKNDLKKIIDNIINYISITENQSVFDLLYDLILVDVNFEIWCEANWAVLDPFKQSIATCFRELSYAKTEQDVIENVLPLFENDNVEQYFYKIISHRKLPNVFLPIYIYYLKKYRKENCIDRIQTLEMRIRDYITVTSVNI